MGQAQNFDAGEDILTYDFSKYVKGKGATGTIPEPTSDQIEDFLETVRQIVPTTKGEDGKTAIDIEAFGAKVEEGSDVEAILYDAVEKVTSGSPSAALIKQLPYRTQRRFLGWLFGVLLDPEA